MNGLEIEELIFLSRKLIRIQKNNVNNNDVFNDLQIAITTIHKLCDRELDVSRVTILEDEN